MKIKIVKNDFFKVNKLSKNGSLKLLGCEVVVLYLGVFFPTFSNNKKKMPYSGFFSNWLTLTTLETLDWGALLYLKDWCIKKVNSRGGSNICGLILFLYIYWNFKGAGKNTD